MRKLIVTETVRYVFHDFPEGKTEEELTEWFIQNENNCRDASEYHVDERTATVEEA